MYDLWQDERVHVWPEYHQNVQDSKGCNRSSNAVLPREDFGKLMKKIMVSSKEVILHLLICRPGHFCSR
jgi:hypothetical protein